MRKQPEGTYHPLYSNPRCGKEGSSHFTLNLALNKQSLHLSSPSHSWDLWTPVFISVEHPRPTFPPSSLMPPQPPPSQLRQTYSCVVLELHSEGKEKAAGCWRMTYGTFPFSMQSVRRLSNRSKWWQHNLSDSNFSPPRSLEKQTCFQTMTPRPG